MSPIRVLLIDDNPQVHNAVSLALSVSEDIALVGQGYSGADVLPLCEEFQPDIILMDVLMPGIDGLTATGLVREQYPNIKILVLSGLEGSDTIHAMLRAGALGYLLKGSIVTDLVPVIQATYTGSAVFSKEISDHLLDTPETSSLTLTLREREVLQMVAQGLNLDEIANTLTINQETANHHLVNILSKLKVETPTEAIMRAAQQGLI